jgi:hypothetical protein
MDSGWPWLAGLSIIIFGCAVMVFTVLLVYVALNHEIAAVRAGRYPAEIGYQRYLSANLGILRVAAPFALLVPLALVVVLASNTTLFNPASPQEGLGSNELVAFVLALGGAAFAFPFSTYDLLAALVGRRALRELRAIQLPLGEAVALRAKRILVAYVPAFILLEVAAVVARADLTSAIIILLVGVVVLIAARRLLAPRLQHWYVPALPIERTQWAGLAPRMQEWARLAGIQLGAVYVQQTERLGTANVVGYGRRRRSINVSDKLLASTDWRQQDALIALGLYPLNSLLARVQLIRMVPLVAVVLLLFALVNVPGLLGQPSTDLSGGGFMVFLLLPVCLAGVLLIGSSIYNMVTSRKRLRGLFFAADRFAVELTGDPMALMVVLNTVAALNGLAPDRRIAYYPSTAERVAALDGLMRQPGPRAPWAYAPVPAVAPVWQGPYSLTVPLQAAPPPGPVPTVRYPVVAPYVGSPVGVPSSAPPLPGVPPAPPA